MPLSSDKKKKGEVSGSIIERVNIALYPHKVGIHISAALISLLKEWIELHIDGISWLEINHEINTENQQQS